MLLREFISFLDHKKIEDAKICFRVYLPLNKGGKYWFYCEPGTSYDDFINGNLLGENEPLHDIDIDPTEFGAEIISNVETYNDDGTPNEISFTFYLDR